MKDRPGWTADTVMFAADTVLMPADTVLLDWDPALPIGTRLREYEVRRVIGRGDAGVVYEAWDHTLRRLVALKEYLPAGLTSRTAASGAVEVEPHAADVFAAGLRAFVAEARVLARVDHPALVKVYRFWEEHGTAYVVMSHCAGPSLQSVLDGPGRLQDEIEVRAWLGPVLDAVSALHATGHHHHRIAPDHIVLTAGGAVLLEFSAARRVLGSLAAGPAAVATAGYAAIEQYDAVPSTPPGAWTDFYALAAVVYRAISGQAPIAATERAVVDRQPPLAALAEGRCSPGFADAIDAALAVQPAHRPHSDAEFRALLGGLDAPAGPVTLGSAAALMDEPFQPVITAELTQPLATQPLPAPVAEAPMEEPFLVPVQPAAHAGSARMPFARAPAGTSRNLLTGLWVTLAGVSAAALIVWADGADWLTRSPAAAAGSRAAEALDAGRREPPGGLPARVSGEAALPPAGLPQPASRTPLPPPLPAPGTPPGTPLTSPPTQRAVVPPITLPTLAARPGAAPPAARAASAGAPVPPPLRSAVSAPPTPPAKAAPAAGRAALSAATRARCDDLLYEASLRRLTSVETAILKKDCR